MMEKILTMLVGLLIALGGWSLSRTFELSTIQAVHENQVEKLERKVEKLENVDTSHTHEFVQHKHELVEHDHPVDHSHTKTLVNEKEIELLKVQIEEIKVKASNPLAN